MARGLLLAALVAAGGGVATGTPAVDPALPRYQPRAVEFPKGAGYVGAGGAIAIVGYNDMREMLEAIDKLFAAGHPGFRFSLVLNGTKTAPPALTSGASALAPMGAEFLDADFAAYREARDSDPAVFRVANDSLDPRALSSPIGIYVARDNPLKSLTTDQVARIFTMGSEKGCLVNWGQLGLTGDWAGRPIHPVGPGAETALGVFMQRRHFHGRPYVPNYVHFHESSDVAKQVGSDPQAIGFGSLFRTTTETRIVPVSVSEGSPALAGSEGDIVSGEYPYNRFLLIYARQPLEAWIREYLRLVLSFEGQSAIAAGSLGYLPLSRSQAALETAKLDL